MDFTTEFSDSGSISVAADDSDLFPASAFQIAKQAQLKNWTDEMHRSYLNSLEASFAKELHNSLQLRAWKVGNKCKVLRDGCCQKTEFKMSDCLMDSTADSPFFSRDMQSSLNHSLLRSCCENRQPKNSITSFSSPENFKGLIEYDFNCRDSVLSTGAQKFLIKTSWMMSRQELLSIQLGLNDEKLSKADFLGGNDCIIQEIGGLSTVYMRKPTPMLWTPVIWQYNLRSNLRFNTHADSQTLQSIL